MSNAYPDAAIIIFAREPVAGKVKSRLAPALGIEGATRLYAQMMHHVIDMVRQSELADIYLYVTPDSDLQYFKKNNLSEKNSIKIQRGHDLGMKMYSALEQTLKNYNRAVLIGTDCPFLNEVDLQEAIDALESDSDTSMVFSPTMDGGYVLVGGSSAPKAVFCDIQWGSENVMNTTRAIMQRESISWKELKTQRDIDCGGDLSSLQSLTAFSHWAIQCVGVE